jgi:hypothetical protein
MNDNEEIIEYEDESLELSESNDITVIQKTEEQKALQKTVNSDFQYARQNIKTIIDTGMEAAENLASLASQSEHPRMYECLSNLLQINSLNNKMLMDIDSQMKDLIDGKEEPDGGDNITNNTLVVATTTDIQRMIEEKIKGSK